MSDRVIMGLTHKGWFYFVPVWVNPDNGKMLTRPFGWFWPILLCIRIHQAICRINGEAMQFPIRIYESEEHHE